ncbi:Predicted dehydrogenase [Haladaptatus litoreus]|uniref:Predicted dehydrogenase n=1 Tax=Haladaptatus litoreus TaxID=553468 RepID=A0A1N6YRZ9_9EURY|nr:Gfo/Idh/MocA family oxidoreductase [Haladaptatus litoreus]SIR17161.1 Predicted dehydrogenase [Haladaptatus litoreus]
MNLGVLGTAGIAHHSFVPAVAKTDHEVTAIASRSEERANSFATDHGIPQAFGSYEELLESDVDAVYLPLPNALHAEWTKRAADHGLHVLCEKPLAVDAEEAREMGDYCDQQGVTLMEAMMFRYYPRTERMVEAANELGEIRSVDAGFHSSLRRWPAGTRFDPDLGGGCLLDVGVYAIEVARLFLGDPERVVARVADPEETGVETQVSGILAFSGGRTAQIDCSFRLQDAQYCRVEGTDGRLHADRAFSVGTDPSEFELRLPGRQVTESFDSADPYALELERFVEYAETGQRPRTDAREAARTLAVVDGLRKSEEIGEWVKMPE